MSAALRYAAEETGAIERAVAGACERIAPSWPLDQLIAVNPYLGFSELPIELAAAQLARLSGTRLVMPRSYYLEAWRRGSLRAEDLQAVVARTGAPTTVEGLRRSLEEQDGPAPRLPLITDLVDEARDLRHTMSWRDYVTHQIGQHCAAFFDDGQASWGLPHEDEDGLYPSWRRMGALTHGAQQLDGAGFAERFSQLPVTPRALITDVVQSLGLLHPGRLLKDYLTALLLSVNGWAAFCAYVRWQDRLARGAVLYGPQAACELDERDPLVHLLAIRLAWEWLLYQGPKRSTIGPRWRALWHKETASPPAALEQQRTGWLLQRAIEHAYQEPLCQGLLAAQRERQTERPAVHAVFCIDVRSERFRRALEGRSPRIRTLGFAGFFGLPVAYSPLGTALKRPQLPGLLAPSRVVTEATDPPAAAEAIARSRQRSFRWLELWQDLRSAASSSFSFVETCGLLYAGRLLARGLDWVAPPEKPERHGLRAAQKRQLRPCLQPAAPASPAELAARCELVAGVLRAMGLTRGHGRLVLLAGHGSTSANNPHAAGLDCGACGGQSGEVNARALAALLNDPQIRKGLPDRGIDLPQDTCFLAGLHNTTTDELTLFDPEQVPPSHAQELQQLRSWLQAAGEGVRVERSSSLGLEALAEDRDVLRRHFERRARSWAEVRPEWGLANNAAFIIAPRWRTRHLNLDGRAFLHEYCAQDDPQLRTLELILTAPMIVTSWINLQYYASTVDNQRYGSGNKVLHNVVGDRLGVFEGNGGDLRIGLPLQSVHDGESFRHTPLRLSVFVEAPRPAIEQILAKHERVRTLIQNEWIHLFQIEEESGVIARYQQGRWEVAAAREGK
ncbi:MAG: DUF2309 domain-containing protein [Polyangia bacterium]